MTTIRTASMADLDIVTAIEAACFPPAEAAPRAEFAARLKTYPGHFWLLEADGKAVSFINGPVSDTPILRDELYHDASYHKENGAWQMIFGVDTLPAYRRRGFAGHVMERVLSDARAQGRKGCVLTCKERLIRWYESFGYVNGGVSGSTHGGAMWYDMRLTF